MAVMVVTVATLSWKRTKTRATCVLTTSPRIGMLSTVDGGQGVA